LGKTAKGKKKKTGLRPDAIPLSKPGRGSYGKTGDWRTFKPVIDREKCNKCMMCWLYCPEGVIDQGKEGYPKIDFTYCKGCGICAQECPSKCIEMVREEK